MATEERWTSAFGWEGFYEVSDLGRIRSIVRHGRTPYGVRSYGGREVKPVKTSNGYMVVNFTKPGGRSQVPLHRLVLLSFVGPCPPGCEACHWNGDRSDNRLENLRWDTRKSNHADKKRHGTWQVGEKSPVHKFTAEQILAIRSGNITKQEAVRDFGISEHYFRNIKSGRGWPHLASETTDAR